MVGLYTDFAQGLKHYYSKLGRHFKSILLMDISKNPYRSCFDKLSTNGTC